MTHDSTRVFVGAPAPHESARDHVTGAALYTDDLISRFAGVLHAWPVTAPHARARVVSVTASDALRVPGVVTILSSADAPGEADSGAARRDEPIFPLEVSFHGQAVTWVLAESAEAARQGAAVVGVSYESLPPILTIAEAIDRESYLTGSLRLARGDMSVLESSALVVDGAIELGGQEHFYLETQAALAYPDGHGGIFVHAATQHPSGVQEVVARVLGLARHKVVVECPRMGGGFGGKEVQAAPYAAVAALGAWKTGRPVRVRLSRELDMLMTGKRHPYLARYRAGFDVDAHLRALRLELFADGGWSLDLSEAIMWRSLFHCDNAYHLPAVEVTGRVCRTNKTSQTAFRGFGGPQGMVVIEEILSRAAERLSLPADVVRERNFYREGQTTHYGQALLEPGRMQRVWETLKASSAFEARRLDVEAWNLTHAHAKRGLAITPVKFGISFTTAHYNQAGAHVLVYRDGSVQVNHGGTEMGQGLFTKVLQIAADALGVRPASVRLMPTRTDQVPNTSATAASSGTDLNGAAVAGACEVVRQRLVQVASGAWQASEGDVTIRGGVVRGPGGREMSFAAVCDAAYLARVPLCADGYYRTPGLAFDAETGQGTPFHYFTYGAAVAEVEVDGFTGMHRLLRADILQDAGDSIAPLIDRGQIEGGFIQGVGWLTLEELIWSTDGHLATAGASTYKLPSWSEVPEHFTVNMLTRAAQDGVIGGSKAVGEPPLMLAICVREALRAAIGAFARVGSEIGPLDSPLTPERVFFAVQRARNIAHREETLRT